MKKLLPLFTLLILSACVTASTDKPAGDISLTLIYSGNMDGELEPCGCSEGGDKGGIKRRVKMVDELREENPELILFTTGGLLVSEMPQDKLKSEYILKGIEALNYDAVGVQWQDLAFGRDFLNDTMNSFVASNWKESDFDKSIDIERSGHNIRFFHWMDPEKDPNKSMSDKPSVDTSTKSLSENIKQAKKQGNTVIVSSTIPLAQARKHLPLQSIDILFIKPAYEVIGEPQLIGNTLVLQPGSRGMRLGRLDFNVNSSGHITQHKHKVIPLPVDVGDAPRMEGWYKEYNDKLRVEYEKRVAARKAMMSGESPYAGEKVCESCHAAEHEKWFDTPHAEAFFKLMDVGKSFDPNCIGCHTVGFEKPGGYLDYMLTKNLANVQCENCHGAAKAHADSGGVKPVANKGWKPEQMCLQCHVQKHSSDFKFETYWPRIKH